MSKIDVNDARVEELADLVVAALHPVEAYLGVGTGAGEYVVYLKRSCDTDRGPQKFNGFPVRYVVAGEPKPL